MHGSTHLNTTRYKPWEERAMQVKGIRKLFTFPGNVVEEINIHPEMVTVRLRWDKRYKLRCPECGTKMAKHKRSRRSVRDLPTGTAKHVHLNIEVIQGKCAACGSCCTFFPEGISNGVKAAWRFQLYVSGLARFMPISSVAETARISASSAWR
jgi:transposase